MRLCSPCSKAWMRWLDYRLPPPPIQLIVVGRQDVKYVRERQEARFKEWRDTVRHQQKLIEDSCNERRARDPLVKHSRGAGSPRPSRRSSSAPSL